MPFSVNLHQFNSREEEEERIAEAEEPALIKVEDSEEMRRFSLTLGVRNVKILE